MPSDQRWYLPSLIVKMGSIVKTMPGYITYGLSYLDFLSWKTEGGMWTNSPMPCPVNMSHTWNPYFRAMFSQVIPISLKGVPGLQILILSYKASYVAALSFLTSGWTSPTSTIREVSPCTPSMKRVTSRFMVSPFLRGLVFGMPWQQTSLTLVQTLLGKPMKPRAVGNALCLMMNSWQILSSSSVVMPSFTWEAKSARV